jgi:hypothetical protein
MLTISHKLEASDFCPQGWAKNLWKVLSKSSWYQVCTREAIRCVLIAVIGEKTEAEMQSASGGTAKFYAELSQVCLIPEP